MIPDGDEDFTCAKNCKDGHVWNEITRTCESCEMTSIYNQECSTCERFEFEDGMCECPDEEYETVQGFCSQIEGCLEIEDGECITCHS